MNTDVIDKDNGLKISVVLPSLKPTEKLLDTVAGLIEVGFTDIIIVNDGSPAEYDGIFEKACLYQEVTLLKHAVNMGKGVGLKTAFTYITENRRDIRGVVTADADGQHLPADILKCSQALLDGDDSVILGARDFSKNNVPIKSYLGNTLTAFVFRTGCGIKIHDTQTGLRVIPAVHLPFFLTIKGDRFEYETNMLLEMKAADIPFKEVRIATVYSDNNKGSHFNAFYDAFKIYKLIFKFMISSVISFLLDNGIFYFALLSFRNILDTERILVCTVIARMISSFFNFNLNKKVVFQHREHYRKTMLRYYILCIPQMLISAGLVSMLSVWSKQDNSGLLTLMKLGVDALLFIISFNIQRDWVFKRR
jgi:glycosyltransferase involved in cell wall biosynthesis